MTEEIIEIEIDQFVYDQLKEKADLVGMSVNDFASKIVNDSLKDGTMFKFIKEYVERNTKHI